MPGQRILIVEDEVDVVEIIKFVLQKNGYQVLEAFDGLEGLEKAKREMPDLIILDIMLPGMSGYKVCRLLKFDERYKKIPILMLTARTQESDKALGKEAGADKYVIKPFEPDELVAIIKEMLGDK